MKTALIDYSKDIYIVLLVKSVMSVSYTHLDVYKRQASYTSHLKI